jgi:hypothetical protein
LVHENVKLAAQAKQALMDTSFAARQSREPALLCFDIALRHAGSVAVAICAGGKRGEKQDEACSQFCKRGSVNVRFAPKAAKSAALSKRRYVPKPDSCTAAKSAPVLL